MTSTLLTDLLKSLSLLGLFLIVGFILRAKVKVFQKTFIPASVIGGTLLLILGPQVLNVLPTPSSWFDYYAIIPGILIVPVVTATPLGLKLDKSKFDGQYDTLKNVIPLAFIGLTVSMLQFAIGFGTNLMFQNQYDLYDVFGIELAIGFVGGHGTAGTLGNMLSEMNLPYWQTSQGVAVTTATLGLVGGILIGIILINWAARSGNTSLLSRPADIPKSFQIGYEKEQTKQSSAGKETTMSSSIDVLGFHAAIIFLGCGLSYLLLNVFKTYNVPILSGISVWAYGMIVMAIIWWIICKLKVDYLIDSKIKGHITGSLTEFAVIAAIASLPLKAVLSYLLPIIVMSVLGYIVTTFTLLFLCKKLLKGYWFEQMIGTLGMATGVFITGVLLLRICDPDLETPALASYSISYSITSVVYFAMLNLFILLPIQIGVLKTTVIALVISIAFLIGSFVSSKIAFGKSFKGN